MAWARAFNPLRTFRRNAGRPDRARRAPCPAPAPAAHGRRDDLIRPVAPRSAPPTPAWSPPPGPAAAGRVARPRRRVRGRPPPRRRRRLPPPPLGGQHAYFPRRPPSAPPPRAAARGYVLTRSGVRAARPLRPAAAVAQGPLLHRAQGRPRAAASSATASRTTCTSCRGPARRRGSSCRRRCRASKASSPACGTSSSTRRSRPSRSGARKFTEKIFPVFLTREAAMLKILEPRPARAYAGGCRTSSTSRRTTAATSACSA